MMRRSSLLLFRLVTLNVAHENWRMEGDEEDTERESLGLGRIEMLVESKKTILHTAVQWKVYREHADDILVFAFRDN